MPDPTPGDTSRKMQGEDPRPAPATEALPTSPGDQSSRSPIERELERLGDTERLRRLRSWLFAASGVLAFGTLVVKLLWNRLTPEQLLLSIATISILIASGCVAWFVELRQRRLE